MRPEPGDLIRHQGSGSGHKQVTGSLMGVTKEEVHQGNVRRKVAEPYVETFGTGYQSQDFLENYERDSYDLTPRGIIECLGLLDVDYNRVSAYGHFGKEGLPWEK